MAAFLRITVDSSMIRPSLRTQFSSCADLEFFSGGRGFQVMIIVLVGVGVEMRSIFLVILQREFNKFEFSRADFSFLFNTYMLIFFSLNKMNLWCSSPLSWNEYGVINLNNILLYVKNTENYTRNQSLNIMRWTNIRSGVIKLHHEVFWI